VEMPAITWAFLLLIYISLWSGILW